MDFPECPVCLQPYTTTTTIPRVLPCGHTLCSDCIAALPPPPPPAITADALRCPSCSQLVPFSRARGPHSLPKNIDLLRLLPPNDSNPVSKTKPEPSEIDSVPGSLRGLVSEWKDFILPKDSIRIVEGGDKGTVACSLGRPWFLRENEKVSLLSIGSGDSCSENISEWFRLSYVSRVVEALGKLGNGVRNEVRIVVDAWMTERRGIARVYGLWMDVRNKTSDLFLVCQLFDRSLYGMVSKERRIFCDGQLYSFGRVGLEICEMVMGLHSRGIVCGCLTDYCFCFDNFGHCILDLNKVLFTARRIWQDVDSNGKYARSVAFVSPELFAAVHDGTSSKDLGFEGSVGYASDVWSLGCILTTVLVEDDVAIRTELEELYCLVQKSTHKNFAISYDIWKEKIVGQLKDILKDIKFEPLLNILESCLCYDPCCRPEAYEIWHCFHALIEKTYVDDIDTSDFTAAKDNLICCLATGNLCSLPKGDEDLQRGQVNDVDIKTSTDGDTSKTNGVGAYDLNHIKNGHELTKELIRDASEPKTLHGHHDCITALAITGGFLFSSSFDKTISVWSLQDFSHVLHLKGHQHRIMAITAIDSLDESLCISGDSGSGIFVWSIGQSVSQEPQQKWYEHNDWRYSGIHSLAVSGTGYLYTGSGDKSIKAWSLQDFSLACTMTGHNSTVSSLAVASGILYSGSWDGTIRLWWLHDHSALAVLGNDTPQCSAPVLSLLAEHELLVSTHENGFLKIWRNNVLVTAEEIHNGAVFALHMYKNAIFTGGWDKTVNIKELPENELEAEIRDIASVKCDAVVTCLLYWSGKLFVGFSNKEIKVYPLDLREI